jgi:hypothetical protein
MITKRITNGYRIYGDSFNQIAPEIERLETNCYYQDGQMQRRFSFRDLRFYACCVDMIRIEGQLEQRLFGDRK